MDRPALSSARGSLTRTMSAKGPAELAAPTQEHSSGRPQLGNLQKVLLERVDMLTKALEQKAVSDFNDWLVRPSQTPQNPCENWKER